MAVDHLRRVSLSVWSRLSVEIVTSRSTYPWP